MAFHHTRSFSFPSNSHPVANQLDEQLCRLRSSQAATTSSLANKLNEVKELYKSVDEFLQLPQNQKTVSQTLSENKVEKVLDGSLRLLEICSTSRDVLVQSKEQLQDIQSVLRRRCSGETNMNNEFVKYQKSRKTAQKLINKCLKEIKQVEKSNDANATETMLKDVQAMTVDVFKSLLSYIGGSQKSSWSFAKKTASSNNKFNAVDELILISQKKKANVDMSQIVHLQTEVQEIDQVLESLFRHLIKTRSTLLNVLSN